jgi:hypothetical protein
MDESAHTSSALSTVAPPSNVSGHADEIRTLVDRMLGSMRATEALDPDAMFAGAEKMFALYPIEVCREVADPGRGYPATERFAPTLADLRLALEMAARPHLLRREREARERKLAQERAEALAPVGPRLSYEELQRFCAGLGLPIGQSRRRKLIDASAESARVREQYGISQAAWDAVPKAEPKAGAKANT